MTLRHFHLPAAEPRHLVLASALDRCRHLLQDQASHEMALALASKEQLVGSLVDALGAEAVRAIERDNVHVRKGLVLHLLTPKIQRRRMRGPVLAVGLSVALLDRVVTALGVTDVVFVPDSSDDLAGYLARFPGSEEVTVGDAVQPGPLGASQREAPSAPRSQG